MNFETVQFEIKDSVAIITMNRPEALNALSMQLTADLRSALRETISQKARAAILTGNGRAFCSGGDLREMNQIAQKEGRIEAFFEEPLELLHGCIKLIREAELPFIAAVNGVCAGAGTNFALACDLVIAADNASFNEAFVKIGLSPDCGGTYLLPKLVGMKRAAELFMLGDSVSAIRAEQIGMINAVVPADSLQEEALKLAKRLAQMPTSSIARIKKMLDGSVTNNLDEQLALEHKFQIESGQTQDFREGVSAFFEKRQPVFKGN